MKPMPKVRGSALTARLNALLAEHGLQPQTVTIIAPLAVLNRLAHSRADATIAADLSFDERFETLGAMLPALSPTDLILPANAGGLPREDDACAARPPRDDKRLTPCPETCSTDW